MTVVKVPEKSERQGSLGAIGKKCKGDDVGHCSKAGHSFTFDTLMFIKQQES